MRPGMNARFAPMSSTTINSAHPILGAAEGHDIANPQPLKVGRPAGDVHLAMLQAAQAIRNERRESGQGATLLELVHRSQVGYQVARKLVPSLKRRGQLQIVGERRVSYRNRPVAEYAPTLAVEAESRAGHGWVDLGRCVSGWAR